MFNRMDKNDEQLYHLRAVRSTVHASVIVLVVLRDYYRILSKWQVGLRRRRALLRERTDVLVYIVHRYNDILTRN